MSAVYELQITQAHQSNSKTQNPSQKEWKNSIANPGAFGTYIQRKNISFFWAFKSSSLKLTKERSRRTIKIKQNILNV